MLGSFGSMKGSFLMDPWMLFGDICLDVSNPNMLVYDLMTSHTNFTQNKYIKLDETCQDTQGHFKARLSNVMDV